MVSSIIECGASSCCWLHAEAKGFRRCEQASARCRIPMGRPHGSYAPRSAITSCLAKCRFPADVVCCLCTWFSAIHMLSGTLTTRRTKKTAVRHAGESLQSKSAVRATHLTSKTDRGRRSRKLFRPLVPLFSSGRKPTPVYLSTFAETAVGFNVKDFGFSWEEAGQGLSPSDHRSRRG